MRPAFTLRLASLDDAQYAVVLIDMLNQFAHAGTISAPSDSATARAQRRVIRVTGTSVEYNTPDHQGRESGFNNTACSITTRGHPHTTSADTRHTYVSHLTEDGVDRRFLQCQVGHEVDSSTAVYTHVSSDYMNSALRRALAPALGSTPEEEHS